MGRPILIVGDLHEPWANKESKRRIYAEAKRRNPKIIIQMGDLYDMLSSSRFAHSQDIYTPKDEIRIARQKCEIFWNTLGDICPDAKRYQLKGNHDERPYKSLLQKAPELEYYYTHNQNPSMGFWEFEGVKTQTEEAQELILQFNGEEICFLHGFHCRPGEHVRKNLIHTVIAHTHWPWVHFHRQRDRVLWEMNVGFIGDRNSVAMGYVKQRKFSKYVCSHGLIDEFGPRVIPHPF